jgi:hypothetical protein
MGFSGRYFVLELKNNCSSKLPSTPVGVFHELKCPPATNSSHTAPFECVRVTVLFSPFIVSSTLDMALLHVPFDVTIDVPSSTAIISLNPDNGF